MAGLVVRIFPFIAGAFFLGLTVGWVFWRFRRRSIPDGEWSEREAALDELQADMARLTAERDGLVGRAAHAHEEVARLQDLLTTAWHQREEATRRVAALEAQEADLADRLEQAAAHGRYLQRRVTELSILAARHEDLVPPSVRPAAPRPGQPTEPGPSQPTPVVHTVPLSSTAP